MKTIVSFAALIYLVKGQFQTAETKNGEGSFFKHKHILYLGPGAIS